MAFAAGLTVILISIYGYRFYQLSPYKLYSDSYVPYRLSSPFSSKEAMNSRIEKFYRQQKFDSVLKTAKRQVTLSDKEALLTGITYLEHGDPFWGIAPLKKLSQNKKSLLKDDGEFYLALAYLKNTDYDQAITLMQRIKSEKDHQYKNRFSSEFIDKVQMLKWR